MREFEPIERDFLEAASGVRIASGSSPGYNLPKRRSRRRIAHSRPRPLPPFAPNSVWAYDFVHDYCANGQKLKCLTIIDEFTRE